MASNKIQHSSSSQAKNFDVFVSFRGTDTRNGFTSHLFAALQRKGVVAFRDDRTIEKGDFLEPELLYAIEGSRVFIIVFSKNYASSTWCLKELTKIVDWVEETDQRLLPIFYDVTPSEVRKQSGEFTKAFDEHEERFKDDLEMVKNWREALKKSSDRCGWDVQNKQQYEEIENVVEIVIDILGRNQIWSFGDDLVDMHSRVKQLEELLDLSANDIVSLVGICGMSGIGKTTLATTLFHKISPQFDAWCYIDDLSKIYLDLGATSAQKQLLCQVLNQGNMEIHHVSHGTMLMKNRLRHLKTLIVLDNVDQVEQLEKLGLHPEYLRAGSRIIIISTDCRILQNYGVNKVYNVKVLDETQALKLLCKKAFKSKDIGKEYKELTFEVLNYVNGLPLAIKVLGSFLLDRDVSEWRSALTRMRENPSKDIMDVLRISYDGLEHLEKEIFLDIACFLSTTSHHYLSEWQVKKILDYRQFHPDIGMKVLIEKSLISCREGDIEMHNLLKVLGKSIVREKAPKEPRKWSRLWNFKDLQKVMEKNKEAKNVEAIVIEQHREEFLQRRIKVDALSKMNHLELLILHNVNCFGTLNYISSELRYLFWNYFPFMSLPSTCHLDQLVELILPHSNIKRLWLGKKCLPNLKMLDLSHSKNLTEVPDLSEVPLLEDLILEGCTEIIQIDQSIGFLRKLRYLNLKNCKKLFLNLNVIFGLSSLRSLSLSGCSKLLNSKMLMDQRHTEHLENVDKNTNVIQLPTSFVFKLLMLPFQFFSHSKPEDSLGLLLSSLSCVPCLLFLDISFCNLRQIPDEIGNLRSLVYLNLGGNKFVTLPSTIKQLSNLEHLNLEHCKQLKYLPELPTIKEKTNVRYYGELYIFDCPKLSEMEQCYSMVFSWMMQNLQVYLQATISSAQMTIVIPGTHIPKWFDKQNASTSINMDPSTVLDDPNWIGVAICVLFVTHKDPMNLGERYHDRFYDTILYGVNNIANHLTRCFSIASIHFEKDLVTLELDHLLTVFYSREQFIHLLSRYPNTMHEFETDVRSPQGLRVVVKNCGYRWVFKEDLQQLNSNMFFSGNSSSRKRKLLISN